jgi:hypothetical protein
MYCFYCAAVCIMYYSPISAHARFVRATHSHFMHNSEGKYPNLARTLIVGHSDKITRSISETQNEGEGRYILIQYKCGIPYIISTAFMSNNISPREKNAQLSNPTTSTCTSKNTLRVPSSPKENAEIGRKA